MNIKIIGISGKSGHGKDYSATIIKDVYEKMGYKVCVIPFATHIKQYAKTYFEWDGSDKTKPRDLLQSLGTDVIRDKLNKPDFHALRTIEDISILKEFFDIFIIPDVRFLNELNYLKDMRKDEYDVKLFRIQRIGYVSKLTDLQQSHLSETSLDEYTVEFDSIIYNDGSENFEYAIYDKLKISESQIDEIIDKLEVIVQRKIKQYPFLRYGQTWSNEIYHEKFQKKIETTEVDCFHNDRNVDTVKELYKHFMILYYRAKL